MSNSLSKKLFDVEDNTFELFLRRVEYLQDDMRKTIKNQTAGREWCILEGKQR